MPKGYWIAHVSVSDPDGYARYKADNAVAFEKYGGRFLARGGRFEEVEGPLGRDRHVIIEFPDFEAAVDCWNSAEYAAARRHREGAGIATITIVEGSA